MPNDRFPLGKLEFLDNPGNEKLAGRNRGVRCSGRDFRFDLRRVEISLRGGYWFDSCLFFRRAVSNVTAGQSEAE